MLGDDDIAIELESSDGAAAIGRVTETGAHAEHLAGKRVLVGPIDPCGECDVCRRGGAAVCPTARRRSAPLTSPVVAAARWVIALGEPDGVNATSAVVAGDLALAYTLYARTGVGPRDPVVVVGASRVARLLHRVIIAKGIEAVVITDEASLAAAREQFTAQGIGGKPWRVLCADGAAVPLAAACCGPRATLTVLATGDAPAIPASLLAREVVVIPVAGAHPDLLVETAALAMRESIDLS
ncbi:MAG TPA: alcohol dehydrogenase catalytic domain-containing protein [Kofleriaceae bacterium]|jgi:threonine dehydrogenase-like Zn-dependent dehydrogenase